MDYYSILGIPKNASEQDIRKAYKQKSMQHHPDRGGNEDEFKKVNEAYQTLKDPQKRQQYDNPQPQYNHDPFADFFRRRQQRTNRNIRIVLHINLTNTLQTMPQLVTYQNSLGETKTVEITRPKGIEPGQIVSYTNLGDDAIKNLPPGNLEVIYKISNDTDFQIQDKNLIKKVDISYFDLLLGTSLKVDTITGRSLSVNVPPKTKPSTVLSVTNEGLYYFNSNRRGKMLLEFKVVMPNLNSMQTELIKSIRDEIQT
jgi:curved DNA-binding protein